VTAPAWAAPYVGIPFRDRGRDRSGLDCWGLVVLVARERYRVELPDLSGEYAGTRDRVGIPAAVESQLPAWDRIPRGSEAEGDVVLFREAGRPGHCGIVLGGGLMLHARAGTGSCVEGYGRPAWSGRVEGFYRRRGA